MRAAWEVVEWKRRDGAEWWGRSDSCGEDCFGNRGVGTVRGKKRAALREGEVFEFEVHFGKERERRGIAPPRRA